MSLPYAAPSFVDGDYTVATAVSLPEFSSPIPASSNEYVFTQDFVQFRNNFRATALNTPHPDYLAGNPNNYTGRTFYLVAEGDRKDQMGGVVRWTRTYAALPDFYSEFQSYLYNFIGYFGSYGNVNPTTIPTGRNRMSLRVESRMQNDFWIANGTIQNGGGGGSYATINSGGDIPVIQAQKYRLIAPFATSWWMDIDWLSNTPTFNFATTPSRAVYETWVKNAVNYGWDTTQGGIVNYVWAVGSPSPTVSDQSTGAHPCQICVEDSTITRWKGNIWLRQTLFVLAQ